MRFCLARELFQPIVTLQSWETNCEVGVFPTIEAQILATLSCRSCIEIFWLVSNKFERKFDREFDSEDFDCWSISLWFCVLFDDKHIKSVLAIDRIPSPIIWFAAESLCSVEKRLLIFIYSKWISSKPGSTLDGYGSRSIRPSRVHLTVLGVTIKCGRCTYGVERVVVTIWLQMFSLTVMHNCSIKAQHSISFRGLFLVSKICWRLTPQVLGPVVVHFFILTTKFRQANRSEEHPH